VADAPSRLSLTSPPPKKIKKKQTPWSESASELYRQSECRLLAKLVPTFADRGFRVVSETHPTAAFLAFYNGVATVSSK
jgi:hypothetical protein